MQPVLGPILRGASGVLDELFLGDFEIVTGCGYQEIMCNIYLYNMIYMIIYVCVCYRDTPLTHSIYIILTFLASFLVKYISILDGQISLVNVSGSQPAACKQ